MIINDIQSVSLPLYWLTGMSFLLMVFMFTAVLLSLIWFISVCLSLSGSFSPSAAAAVWLLSCLLICLHICGANNVLTTRWHHPDVRGICLLQPTTSNVSECSSSQTAPMNTHEALGTVLTPFILTGCVCLHGGENKLSLFILFTAVREVSCVWIILFLFCCFRSDLFIVLASKQKISRERSRTTSCWTACCRVASWGLVACY